jgi:diguanylate cyclase (GGDEF)-like protein/PAS domain S-box-containing protein
METDPTRVLLERTAADECPDLVLLVSDDDTNRCRFASSASRPLFGWRPAELEGQAVQQRVHVEDIFGMKAAFAAASDGRTSTCCFRFQCEHGNYRWCEMTVRRAAPEAAGPLLVAVVRDISGRQEAESMLARQAQTDPLTGVANRTVFLDRVRHALSRLERSSRHVGLLFLDLDRFKSINDSLGHRAGDQVLVEMSQRLLALLRPADTLARLGGDEFAILVEDLSDVEEALALAGRITEAGRPTFLVDGEELSCTLSVGLAVTSDPRCSVEDLLQQADLAMYRAKGRGRDRAELFDERLRTRALRRMTTEGVLRQAIAEQRLRVEYQPIVDLNDGSMAAVEALLRIKQGTRRMQPHEFLQVADESGLLRGIDSWVLTQAVDQTVRWHTGRTPQLRIGMSLNITGRHLTDPSFAAQLLDMLQAKRLPADAIQLEVTERALLEAKPSVMEALRSLREAGVRIGLDDFGTGYSSLGYLRHFPLNFLKIDRSIVGQLGTGPGPTAMARAITEFSHAVGLTVVGVGVETLAQYDILRELGCDQGQGFWWARSTEPAGIVAFGRDRPAASSLSTLARLPRPAGRPRRSRTAGRGRRPPRETSTGAAETGT